MEDPNHNLDNINEDGQNDYVIEGIFPINI